LKHFGWNTRFHVTTAEETIAPIVRQEIAGGVDLVVAVGGDGTIAAVAAGMVNSHVPLGIIPTGTWNAIARHLAVPFSVSRAVKVMTGSHRIKKLDLMAVGDSCQAMNLSIGVSSSMIANTARIENDAGATWRISLIFSNRFLVCSSTAIPSSRMATVIAAGLLKSSLPITALRG